MARNSAATGVAGSLAALFVFFFVLIGGMDLYDRTQTGQGTRSGVVVKLSYKGRISNSWEGSLMLGGVQSGDTWDFSLDPSKSRTASLAKVLQAAELAGSTVTLRYEQRFIWPWQTDTNYLVYEVVPSGSASREPR